MKSLYFLLLLNFSLFITGFSQVRIQTNGKGILGNAAPNNDPLNEMTHEILGLGTDMYRTGSKLSFGDYGRATFMGANVFIGEFGTTDSDAMELGGKNGFHFLIDGNRTAGMTFQKDVNNNWIFNVQGQVRSNGITLTSDQKFKSNIKKIDTGLGIVQRLRGVSYDFLIPVSPDRIKKLNEAKPETEKERQSVEAERKNIAEESVPKKDQLGFVAQEVQTVLPQLVSQDNEGTLSINYIGFIPILVEAIKEQQATIEAMKKEIELLKKK
jgi:hypothetical protein